MGIRGHASALEAVVGQGSAHFAEMPRQRLAPEHEMEHLNRRASEVHQNLLRKRIETAMRNKPACIEPLYEKLRSIGYDDESNKKKDAPSAPSRQTTTLARSGRPRRRMSANAGSSSP